MPTTAASLLQPHQVESRSVLGIRSHLEPSRVYLGRMTSAIRHHCAEQGHSVPARALSVAQEGCIALLEGLASAAG